MPVNFISEHLVRKIQILVRKKQLFLGNEGFCYFDTPIETKYSTKIIYIDRVNKWSPYQLDSIIPTNWYLLNGDALKNIYRQLESNDFFIYKKIEGKDYKFRIKK